MFRTFAKKFLPNPFDLMLKRCAKKGGRRILLFWNRGLGDIALGLYAMVERIKEFIPDAEVAFVIRENLKEGFSMFPQARTIVAPFWRRGEAVDERETFEKLGLKEEDFDLVIEKPSPTDWVHWQHGKIVPKLKWDGAHEDLWKRFGLREDLIYIGVQVAAETHYGAWRNWPEKRFLELFEILQMRENVRILLFGFGSEPVIESDQVIDLRGKTNLFELLSIIKNRCYAVLLPDSGILSMVYYLDESFPIRVVSLWGDTNHGILKQNVASPNPQLIHEPISCENRDLSTVSADEVFRKLLPATPLRSCKRRSEVMGGSVEGAGAIILAGGQGSRLKEAGPKGLFPIRGKALFEWIVEKAPRSDLPVAIMTSPINHQEIVSFFEKNRFFGKDIYFFQQEMSPLLDEKRRPIEVRPGEFLQGPNGNGSLFSSFAKSGLLDLFEQRGVDLVTVIPVDNPLAEPFDPKLIEMAREDGADVVIKCIERGSQDRSMGALVERGGKIEILEYVYAAHEGISGAPLGNTAQTAIRPAFMREAASFSLPVHWVQKKMRIGLEELSVWKGERFVFDAFLRAKKVSALLSERNICYAPLKSHENLAAIEQLL